MEAAPPSPAEGGSDVGDFEEQDRRRALAVFQGRSLAAPARQSSDWIDRLASPGSRIASRLLPPMLFTPQRPGRLAHELAEDDGNRQTVDEVHTGIKDDVKMDGPSTSVNHAKTNIQSNGLCIDGGSRCHQNDGSYDIDSLLKKLETITRDDFERLVKIVRSRLVSSSNDVTQPMDSSKAGLELVEAATGLESKVLSNGRASEPLNILEHDGASDSLPVEIAKAFMRGQAGSSPTYRDLLDKRAATPICWPGSAVQNAPGYATPQGQRHRIGFTSTPYSRPSKFPSIGQRSQIPWKKEASPLSSRNQAAKMAAGLANRSSGGPMRRERQRPFGVTTPGGGNFSSFLESAPGLPSSLRSSSNVFQPPNFKSSSSKPSEAILNTSSKNFLLSGDSKASGGLSMVHPHSSAMALKILEHLERACPSPKKKSAELNMAAQNVRPILIVPVVTSPNQDVSFDDNTGKKSIADGSSTSKIDKQSNHDLGFGIFNSGHSLEVGEGQNKFSNSLTKRRDDVLRSENNEDVFGSARTQFQKVDKSSFGTSGTDIAYQQRHDISVPRVKPNLSSISVVGQDGRRLTSDAAAGFTFPLAAGAHGDMPTPTLSTSNGVNNLYQFQSKEEDKTPKFTFGSANSVRGPVFTLPSTFGSARSETAVPQFSLGSNANKQRISFSTVGKDGR